MVLVAAAVFMFITSAAAEVVLMDPPPTPSGGSRAEPRPPGLPRWVEIGEVAPAFAVPPLLRSDSGDDKEQPNQSFVTPPPTIQWDAIIQPTPGSARPPDDTVAAGTGAGALGRVVEATNVTVQLFNKLGASIAATPLATMFPPAPGTFVYDPKVLFDQASGRFFIVVLEVGFAGATCTSALVSNRIRIAVSTSATPGNLTTNWTFLAGGGLLVIGGATTWADYPSIGADSDSVFVTTNQFDAVCTYRGANIRVFNKAALLAGAYTFVDVTFNNAVTTGTFTLQPAHVFGATDNGGFYLISRFGPAQYRIYNIMGDPGAPVATTGLFPWAAGAFPADTTADQCTVAAPDLDTLATRVQNAVYRNGRLWCTLTSDPDGDGQTEVVWQQIATNSYPAFAPTVAQAGFINGGGTPAPWTYMPSINVNSGGDAIINYEQSSATQCPSVMAAIRLNADPPGTFQAPVTVRASASYYDSVGVTATDRWGDYSGAAVDPTDQCFWMVNEYSALTAVNASLWGTHIAKFCTSTEGACCFGATVCGNRTAANCATQGGTFRGVGSKCPTQNVQSAMHQNGPIVHWVNPAVNCNSITPLVDPLVSNCCTQHLNPGCDTPTCASQVCLLLPHCCNVAWDQNCVLAAQDQCGTLCSAGGCDPLLKIDAWSTSTAPSEPTCDPLAIPPGFFGPGSDPFIGTICYRGQPLGSTPFGDFAVADTLVRRFGDPFDRCEAPSQDLRSVPIEIVALNLVSVNPIIVTSNGGQNPTPWNVAVGLSQVPAQQGTMTVRKTHCNGGTWSSVLPVQAKFTFTNVQNPTHVLDTGLQGDPPIILQLTPHEWVSDLDPDLHLEGATCTNFHPGIQDPNPSTDCDCNLNGVRDECDVASGAPDCNQNGKPDGCDPDGDLDLLPDDCDNCPLLFNPDQTNSDLDRFGDACDLCPLLTERREGDHDGDKVLDVPNVDFPFGDNCPCVSNYTQQDTDGDGTGDACALAPSGDIPLTLRIGNPVGGNIALTWGPSCRATDIDYDVYEGTMGGSFTSHLSRACGTGGLTSLTLTPRPGNRYYLIVPSNGPVEGSYGRMTAGQRPPSVSPCRPQSIGPCP